jgi:hypothetical protein
MAFQPSAYSGPSQMSSGQRAALAAQGVTAASGLLSATISNRGARKLEAARRKTEKATAKSRTKIEASKARIAEMEAKREEAAAAARQAEAEATAQAQKTKWIVGGVVGVGVLGLLGLGFYLVKSKDQAPQPQMPAVPVSA